MLELKKRSFCGGSPMEDPNGEFIDIFTFIAENGAYVIDSPTFHDHIDLFSR